MPDIIDPTKPGPRLNIKTVLSTYADFHVKDKTAVRESPYLVRPSFLLRRPPAGVEMVPADKEQNQKSTKIWIDYKTPKTI